MTKTNAEVATKVRVDLELEKRSLVESLKTLIIDEPVKFTDKPIKFTNSKHKLKINQSSRRTKLWVEKMEV